MNFLCKVYLRTIYNLQLQYIDLIAELLKKFHDCYKILLFLQINFKYMLHIFIIINLLDLHNRNMTHS